MFKTTIRAGGIRPEVGPEAALDIENEFRKHRQWHQQVTCSFSEGTLTLVAFNDFDRNGLALSDEFSDCLSAYVPAGSISDEGQFEVATTETS